MKTLKKKKKKFKFCKLRRVLRQHLCKTILSSEKYKVNVFTSGVGKCRKQEILDSGEIYSLNMVACVPLSDEKKLYFLSPTGEVQPSLFLFLREKTGEEPNSYDFHLKAKIILSDSDLQELKHLKKEDTRRKWRKFDDALTGWLKYKRVPNVPSDGLFT